MKKTTKLILAALMLLCPFAAKGQNEAYDVFKPISKYLAEGDVIRLSSWFDDNLELSLPSRTINCSKNQAAKTLHSFFSTYTPHAFILRHQASKSNMKYCLGELKAGGENFEVTVFLVLRKDRFLIQQIKIDRKDELF